MIYVLLVVLELCIAFLFQQRERAAYLKYLLMDPFEVER